MASTLIGQGAYTVQEIAHLLRRKKAWVESWLKTFSKTRTGYLDNIWCIDDIRVLTFADFIELYLMSIFEEQNIKRSKIRKAAAVLANRYHESHPFTLKACLTDCIDIFIEYFREEETMTEDISSQRGQLVINGLLDIKKRVEFRIEYDDSGRAQRFWPMAQKDGRKGRIVMDPERQMGRPIDEESGVTARVLYLALRAEGEENADFVARSYHVAREALDAAVAYEESLTIAA